MHSLRIGNTSELHIGYQYLQQPEFWEQAIEGPSALLISGKGVPAIWSESVISALRQLDKKWDHHVLPDQETDKTLTNIQPIFDTLVEGQYARDTTLIALGGGVVGDMTGFTAACYQRGVSWINLPTTLLSQADACIGGKTGVNHPQGKNMIGAFHHPTKVLTDVATLSTLPQRQLRAGLAEIIKHAVIADIDLLDWLERKLPAFLQQEPAELEEAVFRSCSIKARIVERDQREKGERALLNFGHTFGHAIEAHQKYSGLLHGEAVSIGMAMALQMSYTLENLNTTDGDRVLNLLERAGLPISPAATSMRPEDFLIGMAKDKKILADHMRLILCPALGHATIRAVDIDQQLQPFLQRYLNT
ncbi:MAG: 3-dehydroquinate synthase [Gammaproteobacteria bacterium]